MGSCSTTIYTQREIYLIVTRLYISSSYYFSFPVLLFPIQFNICRPVSGCDKLNTNRMINTVFFVWVHTTYWHIKSTNSNWHKLDDSCWKAYFHTCNFIKRCHNKSSYFKTFIYQEVNKLPGHMIYGDIVLYIKRNKKLFEMSTCKSRIYWHWITSLF